MYINAQSIICMIKCKIVYGTECYNLFGCEYSKGKVSYEHVLLHWNIYVISPFLELISILWFIFKCLLLL